MRLGFSSWGRFEVGRVCDPPFRASHVRRAGHRPALRAFSPAAIAFAAAFAAALSASSFAADASAAAHPIVAAFERFHSGDTAESALAEGGLLLLNELNCVACHAPPEAWRERIPGRGKISLGGIGERLSAAKIGEFVRDPGALKPGTLMPQLAARTSDSDRALVSYLVSLASHAPVPARSFPPGNTERGKQLFESVGCVACHAPATGATSYASVPLGLAAHHDRGALAAFVQNPLHLRPAGRMPAMELTDAEAADLADFLGAKNIARAPPSAPGDITAGRAEFAAHNCAACHDTGEAHASRAVTPLARAQADRGCLASSPPPVGVPRFGLSATQVRALTAALRAVQAGMPSAPLTAEQSVATRFEQLNCFACHEWRKKGGAESPRAKFFTAREGAVESLGELGRLPPALDHAGRKLTPEWLEKLLWGSGGGVRPYLSVRMPRYGRAAAGDLVGLLADACRPGQPLAIDTSGGLGHQRSATGRTLIGTGTGGLGCVTCHGLKDREPAGIRSINLTATATRLQPEYFKALLLDPQGLQPGTIMPPLFAARKGADKEIESMWTYFKELDQIPVLPDGLAVAGSFELKPEEEKRPIVFRTFLEGAGTHAIAVGNPAGAHAAFDSFEVRWALVWRGRFLDAQSNWEERPMKPVKALGHEVRLLSNHMPLAQLGGTTEPWPTMFGRQAGFVFKGYRLGPDGVPTIHYAVAGLEVEDTLRPIAGAAALRRRVVVRGRGTGWFFRGVAADAPRQPIVWENGAAVLEEVIQF